MTPLKLAVLGAGHLGRIHARLLSRIEGVELVGVVDPIAENRDGVAEEFNARAFASHTELIGRIDAAVVAAPTPLHHALTMDLLDAGIHCLVEKPITATASQADELIARAEAGGLILSVGHVERFNPAFTAVADRLEDPKYIEGQRTSGYTGRSTDVGVVMDLMIHDIDAVLSLVHSPVEHVDAIGLSVLGGCEDVVNARIRFASGCVASLTASRVSYTASRRMQVYAPTGFATIDFGARNAVVVDPTDQVLTRAINAPVRCVSFPVKSSRPFGAALRYGSSSLVKASRASFPTTSVITAPPSSWIA